MQSKKLKIIPLGGLGEFGMNCLAPRWEDDIIVIDAGLMFTEVELLGFYVFFMTRKGYCIWSANVCPISRHCFRENPAPLPCTALELC
jgi:hypothetical protein